MSYAAQARHQNLLYWTNCFPYQVPDLVAFYPLNAAYGTKEIDNRVAQGVPSGVSLAPGPDGTAGSSYEFAGTANSYIEFPNSQGGPLDVRYSMTMLSWVYHQGQDGPLFNYKTSGQLGGAPVGGSRETFCPLYQTRLLLSQTPYSTHI